MSFNYGREEKKWRLWKETEEKQLRGLGVSEDTIEQLRTHDWAVFNSDRRYYRSSVAKFTLHIPRSTHSLTSSSLSPDAP